MWISTHLKYRIQHLLQYEFYFPIHDFICLPILPLELLHLNASHGPFLCVHLLQLSFIAVNAIGIRFIAILSCINQYPTNHLRGLFMYVCHIMLCEDHCIDIITQRYNYYCIIFRYHWHATSIPTSSCWPLMYDSLQHRQHCTSHVTLHLQQSHIFNIPEDKAPKISSTSQPQK